MHIFSFKWHKLYVKIFRTQNNKWNGLQSERTTWVRMPFVRANWNCVLVNSLAARPRCPALSPAGWFLVPTLGSTDWICKKKYFLMHFHFRRLHLFRSLLSLMWILNGNNSYFLRVCLWFYFWIRDGKYRVREWTWTLEWQ